MKRGIQEVKHMHSIQILTSKNLTIEVKYQKLQNERHFGSPCLEVMVQLLLLFVTKKCLTLFG